MEQLSVREIERRASLFYGDGVLDIVIGLGVLVFGVISMFHLGPLAGAYLVLLFPIIRSLRRRITYPRMYHLDFVPEPYSDLKMPHLSVIAPASVIIMFVIGLLVFLRPAVVPARASLWLKTHSIIALGLSIASVLVLLGWGTRVHRLMKYAVVSVAALVCGYWFNVNPAYYFTGLGCLILVCGGMVLVRFIRKYPRGDR